MQNLEEIKTEFAKKFDKYSFEFEDETMGEIIDYWLKKWQERELALWQAMEEKKIPENPKAYSTTLTKKQIGHNNGISEAQSLLSVNSSKE